jgi:pimeloyl-ACP methyl ester carboxylesterase
MVEPALELKHCSLERAEIAYLDLGTGPALLLIHGFPLDHTMWAGQHPLSRHFRLLIPDLPGFGKSHYQGPQWTLEDIAKVLIDWLDAIEVPQLVYCGLSMGGYVGWRVWRDYPHRLQGLIACNTRAAADSETVARARRMNAAIVRQQGVAGLAAEMLPRLLAESTRAARPELVRQLSELIGRSDPGTVAEVQLAMAARPDATSWLAEIKCPALFVAGEYDGITPSAEMRANSERLSESGFVEISAAGHLSPLESPRQFNQAVLDFLSGIPLAGG